MKTSQVKINVLPNGPLMVEGKVTVIKNDGKQEEKDEKTFLCRCGASGNKPYCDGSHMRINFVG
ncbi:MAG: CDGSH iron-sulfur domain-containing protein [Bacteroidetes bacterium]|nr:CDGSH iron-sulfur domain-containing protein [Bacteroidota bacterium]